MRRIAKSTLGLGLATGVVFRASIALADTVTPGPDVTTRVIVRASASGTSAQIGSLLPGQEAQSIGSVPDWHEVQLSNGVQGCLSKRWTRVGAPVVSAFPNP
jgi:hypothetical protein